MGLTLCRIRVGLAAQNLDEALRRGSGGSHRLQLPGNKPRHGCGLASIFFETKPVNLVA